MQGHTFFEATHVGLIRSNNEDAVLADGQLNLWLVADGMGGHDAGEVASDIARQVVQTYVAKGKDLPAALQAAHHAVLKAAIDGTGKYGMGSTIVAVKSLDCDYQVAWVGDSRAYLWSKNKSDAHLLTQLTTDHSYVQLLFKKGLISAEEMQGHPEKNVITQCLGSSDLKNVDIECVVGRWHSDDWILLCSDGLTDTVTDAQIAHILTGADALEMAVNQLIQAALDAGGRDNVSVILVAAPSPFPKPCDIKPGWRSWFRNKAVAWRRQKTKILNA